MQSLGWERLDILLVTGDAYVDHPSFGAPLLGKWLAAHGLKVGLIPQPRWDRPDDVARLGRPRLFAGITAGALDSMLAHYTAFRKKRHDDAYTPGGRAGARPNRACIAYTGVVRQAFPGLIVALGGVEASLRRSTHYDFWSNKVRRSILLDAKADLVFYGMAERSLLQLARALQGQPDLSRTNKEALAEIAANIRGCAHAGDSRLIPPGARVVDLPSHEEILADPALLVQATLAMEEQIHQGALCWARQKTGQRTVIFNPAAEPLDTAELDALYGLPFTRQAHPCHGRPVPAEEMIRFSITSHRGCGGGCSFCSLALHQGRTIRSRSARSIHEEAARFGRHPLFAGSISDVGGPSANMWGARCARIKGVCQRASCLSPEICPNFEVRQQATVELLRHLGCQQGIKHVRVASGVRHDLALTEPAYVRALVQEFTGGQLKLAPEHSAAWVLALMRKPAFSAFRRFLAAFEEQTAAAGKEQFVVPYLMSAFPGCTEDDMRALAHWFRRRAWRPRQVQCFIPTPGTLATAMFHAGVDSHGRPITVARTDNQRRAQHRILTDLLS